MKKLFFVLIAAGLIFPSVDATAQLFKKSKKKKETVAAPVMANRVDSMSYAFGVLVGSDLAQNVKAIPGGEFNADVFIDAFVKCLKEDSTILMKADSAGTIFQEYMMVEQEKEQQKKKEEGENFLKENAAREGVHTTESGLQYEIIRQGEGPKPTAESTVKVHYEGFLLDGQKFDSSVERGEPVEFPLNHVIKGWSEGVQLMPVGSKYKLYVPYSIGYGEAGASGVIPPYATLIFDVELLEIVE